MTKRIIIILGILCCFGQVSGFGKKARPRMDDEAFINLYVQLAHATEENLADSVKLHNAQEEIFKRSGFTKRDFDAYMIELDKQPERWAKIWERISEELEKLKPQQADSTKKSNVLPEPSVPPALQKH